MATLSTKTWFEVENSCIKEAYPIAETKKCLIFYVNSGDGDYTVRKEASNTKESPNKLHKIREPKRSNKGRNYFETRDEAEEFLCN